MSSKASGAEMFDWASFSEPTRRWFERTFEQPTRVQRLGWPRLAAGEHSLLLAPTGSGKTLAAFLWSLDRCFALSSDADRGVRVLYVSPLKALVYDIERNLRAPLVGIQQAAQQLGQAVRVPRVDVRTGDTPAADRRRQLREPGEIMATTPESLFLLLGSRAAETLRTVHTVIIDEIHAVAPSKRGAHLALSLERLSELTRGDDPNGPEPQRIGLSATVDPPEEAARFLGGDRSVSIVDASEPAHVVLQIVVPVPDMENPPQVAPSTGGSIFDPIEPVAPREQGLWPSIYPRLLDLIEEHRSTIIFTNSRGLCERLAQRLNELWHERRSELDSETGLAEENETEPVRAHHGSVSHGKRAEIEDALKAGSLRGIVATSSLELGIDMGAVDLVVLVESPGSVASGLQRVGRSGHSVGELSEGVIVPKFRGDLLECAVIAERMEKGAIEPIRIPMNALDVLAQQLVAMCAEHARSLDELLALVRRSHPYRELTREAFVAVLDMLSGRYPSEEFADLRPRLSWDRSRDLLSPRRGAATLVRLNAGTIPDRGLYGVYLGEDGPRLGELDEEMVHESRKGDTFYLGASTWRVLDITRDRVVVAPAPGEPGRMPFWRGEGPGRPIELGRALGAFLRRLGSLNEGEALKYLSSETPLDDNAVSNLYQYVAEQKEHTGTLPTDRAITVERFRDELGDWRICILTPFGSRVHAPWAMALEQRLSTQAGFAIETMYTDDGIVLRLADGDDLPALDQLVPDPEDIEELIVDQVGNSALFASLFRENAARALLLPRRRPGKRTALWQQRLRAKNLLAVVRGYPDFPIVLETYRQCLRDVFDLPSLIELLQAIRRREVRVDDVETPSASPFARSLVFSFVGQYLYELDAPLAERKAQALTLDRALLRELLGQEELRDLLDAEVIEEVELELQGLAYERRARSADELHDLLRRVGDLTGEEIAARCGFVREGDRVSEGPDSEGGDAPPIDEWLARLARERRSVSVAVSGERRFIAAEDAARYRDALGIQPPPGLPEALLEPVESPLESLLRRYARSRGPFTTGQVAERFGLMAAQVEPLLENLLRQGRLVRAEIRPGGHGLEWCDAEILRRIKRRTLARLRREVAAVEAPVLARFLPRWHGSSYLLDSGSSGTSRRDNGPRTAQARLDEVLAQLEGLPLPWSSLHREILPARIPGFETRQLDLLAASGELVWVGAGALGARDGRVALYRRDRVRELLEPPSEYELPSDLHGAILDYLEHRGASFTAELEAKVWAESDARQAAAHRIELETTLWDLVWAGLITNDTFLPFASLGQRRPRQALGAPGSVRRGVRRAIGRSGRRDVLAGGRWSRVEDLLVVGDDSPTATERSWALVQMLLERYGVVSREAALAEEIEGGFQRLYPVLQEMEDAGRVRRGYFVEGLSGRQFALAGAVDRLRSERESERSEDAVVEALLTIDPANPWGALLPWPQRNADQGARPRRVAGSWLVCRGGEPMLYLESSGRSLLSFRQFADLVEARRADRVVEALADVARRRRKRSLLIEKIDGLPAAESRWAGVLLENGFQREYRGLVWSVGSSAEQRGGQATGLGAR